MAPRPSEPPSDPTLTLPSTLHFIGIGGVGMSAVAHVWQARGHKVSGSDAAASGSVSKLIARGIPVAHGHAAEHLPPEAEGVVVSTAVKADNPELVAAQARKLPVFHRSQVLGAIMKDQRSIAVTGTHGKTTTTAMIASVLMEAGWDPTVLIGGDLPHMGGNARAGATPFVVAEADESDKSITNLWAEFVVVTNLEGDHLEHYKDLDEIIQVVAGFINALPPTTKVIACVDDAGVRTLLARVAAQVVTYGFSPEADFRISEAELTAGGSTFAIGPDRFALQVPGRHNIANATAAIAACRLLGVDTLDIAAGLATFMGVKRRFQTVGSVGGVTVIDDYAHHPSEIKATIQTARLLNRPVHAVFQPHRHSRLEALLDDFAASFGGVTSLTLLDTYAAGEAPRAVTVDTLAERIRAQEPELDVRHMAPAATVEALADAAKAGDLILLLGAGDITALGTPLVGALERRFEAAPQSA